MYSGNTVNVFEILLITKFVLAENIIYLGFTFHTHF